MDIYFVNSFIGQYVYATIEYYKQMSKPMLVSEGGWLLKNKNNNNFTLAFYTKLGDLDFLPVFEHEEIRHLEYLGDKQLDMNLVAPEWRVDMTQGWAIRRKAQDGETDKGPYQTSGLNWL